jgi:hypothetical protein
MLKYASPDRSERRGGDGMVPVKGRAFAAEVDSRAKPGALTRDINTRLSAVEADPQTKPGAPASAGVRANTPAPAAGEQKWALSKK